MKKLLVLLLAAGCGPLEPSPILAPPASTAGLEGMASTSGRVARCEVKLVQIDAPVKGPLYWVRATYDGTCYAPPATYPYWPAPLWTLAEPPGPGIQPWGADPFIAYIWPEVPGTYTVTATSPAGKSATIFVSVK